MTEEQKMQDETPWAGPVLLSELERMGESASKLLTKLLSLTHEPFKQKQPPLLSGEQLAELCGLSKNQVAYRIKQGAPAGTVGSRGDRRKFTVEEVQQWTRAERRARLRPKGAKAAVMTVAFFKGGVTKTTTAMVVAQGLSLLGHRVLNIDLDPQGSLSTLHGLQPETEIDYDSTLGPLFEGLQSDVRYCISKTYWPNIDLIKASGALFNSEFTLPIQQLSNDKFEFWNVLNKGLEAVKDDYDVIIIDTPPSLSYMTFNAFYAADGLLVPMTTNALDIASSAQFWRLFGEYAETLARDTVDDHGNVLRAGTPKDYDFVNILLSKVNNSDTATVHVKNWIRHVYGTKVLTTEIPETSVAKNSVNRFKTAFDIDKYEGDHRTFKRARVAYDALARTLEDSLWKVWTRQLTGSGEQL